jgi:hypothetical protein
MVSLVRQYEFTLFIFGNDSFKMVAVEFADVSNFDIFYGSDEQTYADYDWMTGGISGKGGTVLCTTTYTYWGQSKLQTDVYHRIRAELTSV